MSKFLETEFVFKIVLTIRRTLVIIDNTEISALDESEEDSAIVGTRFETRKKYWQFALPDI